MTVQQRVDPRVPAVTEWFVPPRGRNEPSRTLVLMWIIAGHERVDADRRDDYVAAHADLMRRAREAPGCLDCAITADPIDLDRVNNYERWESWAAIEAWRAVANAPDTDIETRDATVMAYEIASERTPF